MSKVRTLSLLLAVVMIFSIMPVYADTAVENGTGRTQVELKSAATKMSVTVPSVLPIHMDEDGNITCAQSGVARIINNSFGPVEVKECKVETNEAGWSLADFTTDFRKELVDIKKFGMQIMSANADPSTGNVSTENFTVINGDSYMIINYDGVIAAQSATINETIVGNVVFTIGWSIYNDISSLPELEINAANVNDIVTVDGSGKAVIPSTYTDGNGVTYRITSIGESAFANRTDITSVSIPATVSSIGRWAFAGSAVGYVETKYKGLGKVFNNSFDNWRNITWYNSGTVNIVDPSTGAAEAEIDSAGTITELQYFTVNIYNNGSVVETKKFYFVKNDSNRISAEDFVATNYNTDDYKIDRGYLADSEGDRILYSGSYLADTSDLYNGYTYTIDKTELELVTFTVNGDTYKAPLGVTYDKWEASKYYSDKFSNTGYSNYLLTYEGETVKGISTSGFEQGLSIGTLISSNHSYMVYIDFGAKIKELFTPDANGVYNFWTVGSPIKINIDNVEYDAVDEMTWVDWINSEYNIDNFRVQGDYIVDSNGKYLYSNSKITGESNIIKTWYYYSGSSRADTKVVCGDYKLVDSIYSTDRISNAELTRHIYVTRNMIVEDWYNSDLYKLKADSMEFTFIDDTLYMKDSVLGVNDWTKVQLYRNEDYHTLTRTDIFEYAYSFRPYSNVYKEGTTGDVNYQILLDGTLRIYGTGATGNYDYYSRAPWYYDRSMITKLVVEDGVTSIGSYNFSGLSSLTDVTIADTVTSVGSQNTIALSDVFIPAGLTDTTSIKNCLYPTTSVTVSDSNPVYKSLGNAIVEKSTGKLVVGYGISTIEEGVTEIADNAFDSIFNYSGDINLTFPSTLTTIGDNAFAYGRAFKSVVIPDSVTTIKSCAFKYCSNMTTVTLGKNVETLESSVFLFSALENVNFPGTMEEYNASAWHGYSYPSTVTSIHCTDGDITL